jgi:hypothetical protein
MKVFCLLSVLLFIILISGCTKTTEEQIQEYLEFYYPTTGEFTYIIEFEWGQYEIFTGAKMEAKMHADSEPFKGFITFRPTVTNAAFTESVPAYLVTPEGEVWKTIQLDLIPESTTRKEMTEEKTEYGTSTQTRTINSSSEPMILSFKHNKEIWKRYGTLTGDSGQSSFEAAK